MRWQSASFFLGLLRGGPPSALCCNLSPIHLLPLRGPQIHRGPRDPFSPSLWRPDFPSFCEHDGGGAAGAGQGRAQPAPPLCWAFTPRPVGSHRFFRNSDDHLLKNIELFDKLSLRFNGRVLFIKDVIGDEICCWSFYGQGRKLAEVCCTSIVYATEKKQTKVRGFCLPVCGCTFHRRAHILLFPTLTAVVAVKDKSQCREFRERTELCSG